MKSLVQIAKRQFLGLTALVLVVGGLADAATGGNVILGKVNNANQTTTLDNSGAGPALALQVKKGQPPLAVSSTKLVQRFNAQFLGGRGASYFAPKSYAYSKQQSDSKYAPTTGSPNYLNAASAQLLGAANIADQSVLGAAATFYSADFVAPAAGTIVMDLFGTCRNSGASNPTLGISVGDAQDSFELLTNQTELCHLSVGQHVSEGEQIQATVVMDASDAIVGTGELKEATVEVMFQPD